MSGPFGSTPFGTMGGGAASAAAGDFYNGVISQSLRFDNARNTFLNKPFTTAQTNTKKIKENPKSWKCSKLSPFPAKSLRIPYVLAGAGWRAPLNPSPNCF